MCGIFAFHGHTPDPDMLAAAATGAARRGPHGHGWATPNTMHHALGPLDASRLPTVGPLIGHARLATVGHHDQPVGLQPAYADGHWLALNGTARAHLNTPAPSDAFVLADTYANHRADGQPPHTALEHTIRDADLPAWAVIVLDATGQLAVSRRRLPLHEHVNHTGRYLSSASLPDSHPLPEGTHTWPSTARA